MNIKLLAAFLLTSTCCLAQSAPAAPVLDAPITLPIIFTSNVAAHGSHAGEGFQARTTQSVTLAGGQVLPKGARITGHVDTATPFVFDNTPYARQKTSVLSIRFDSVEVNHQAVPLNITVRAIADPVTSIEAQTPINHDIDPSGTTTQIGGDQRYPWNAPVTNEDGDIVAYSRHGGVYAHLIASGRCDASTTEVSVGIYSASACGLYGFPQTTAEEMGSPSHPSVLTLASTHDSPRIWKGSTALLEVIAPQSSVASR
ncbi:hypothetical protein [Silvibacterium dinghuense]|uniref:Uncharacterized protein n=1 Tax=Silvibacterium dinghuense TaxID=1560006 RepID=A0A4Q1SDA0_9BACT|nr:hypothetical protein [Silvibacterium dinghuense]RXS95194.1 hypothetical protein ESZ00_11350 [Silvibacterium dinghuense]GGH11437.1 hypothetical protein GCM10011586_30130 [Silvibacterium dinghuense]